MIILYYHEPSVELDLNNQTELGLNNQASGSYHGEYQASSQWVQQHL